MSSVSTETEYGLVVPKEVLATIPEDIFNDEVRLREHLLSALKIGLQAMANAGISLSTDEINRAIRESVEKHETLEKEFQQSLETLIENKLTGKDSLLAIKLGESFGEQGALKTRLTEIYDDISNPDKTKSIPNRVSEVMKEKFNEIEKEITSALDLTAQDSPLKKFLDEQKSQFSTLNTDLRTEMDKVKMALDVDEKLSEQQQQTDVLKKKSTGKGDDFEVDAVEILENLANVLGDSVEHTGGTAAAGSYAKVGDITIRIIEPNLPEMSISIEAKSGGYPLKELMRQMKGGMSQRNCDAAIGLVTRDGKGSLKHSEYHENPAYGIVATVDWLPTERDEADWITLEVAYRVTRNRLIASHRMERDSSAINIDEIEAQVNAIKTQLQSIQAMKSNSTKAKELISTVRESLDTLESEIRSHLTRIEKTLQNIAN
jgi:hypothetical protein